MVEVRRRTPEKTDREIEEIGRDYFVGATVYAIPGNSEEVRNALPAFKDKLLSNLEKISANGAIDQSLLTQEFEDTTDPKERGLLLFAASFFEASNKVNGHSGFELAINIALDEIIGFNTPLLDFRRRMHRRLLETRTELSDLGIF